MHVHNAVGGDATAHAAHRMDDGPLWQQGSVLSMFVSCLRLL